MLRWRLLVGTSIVAALVALGWLDHRSTIPGLWLAPVLALLALGALHELLQLFAANGLKPWPPAIYFGTVLVLFSPWGAMLGCTLGEGGRLAASCVAAGSQWTLLATAIAVLVVFGGEMARYQQPGRVTMNLAAAIFAVIYLGFLLSFLVQLRFGWGIGAIASLVITTKMGDTGAYFVGKAFGRHPLAPRLSPKKTLEGVIGGIIFSVAGAWATAWWLLPLVAPTPHQSVSLLRWTIFAIVVTAFAILGDLGESLLKRDSQCKDSSAWIPGLGGMLDMLDSVLATAPIAYAFWATGFVGP